MLAGVRRSLVVAVGGCARRCAEQGAFVEVLAAMVLLLLLYGLCWLDPGTQICRTQGG
jgi:hypothetical protein